MRVNKALLELHGAVFLFGIAGLFGKLVAASPLTIVMGRTTFAALAILIGLKLSRVQFSRPALGVLGLMFLSGLVLAVHWVTFFHAIQISTVAIGLIGFSTFPLFVTFLEPMLFGHKLRGIDIVCAIAVAVGLILVVPSFDVSHSGTIGLLWAIFSGFLFAILALINRHLVASHSFLVVVFFQHSSAALCLLPFAITYATVPSWQTVWLLLILGIFCTALPQTLFIKSLTTLKAQLASVVTGLEPVYAILFAALFLGEIPDWRTVLGTTIVLGAVVLAMRSHSSEADAVGGESELDESR